jgi:hypothetical protein
MIWCFLALLFNVAANPLIHPENSFAPNQDTFGSYRLSIVSVLWNEI